MIAVYHHHDTTYTVDLQRLPDGTYRVKVNDREYIVQPQTLADGSWKLIVDGERHTVYTAAEGTKRFVKVDGDPAHTLTVPDQRTTRRRTGTTGSGSLVAQMPGQVVDVYVAEGDAVTAGQTLLVLEAMKMEIRIAAPYEGIVKQIRVKKGDLVQREQALIEITVTPS